MLLFHTEITLNDKNPLLTSTEERQSSFHEHVSAPKTEEKQSAASQSNRRLRRMASRQKISCNGKVTPQKRFATQTEKLTNNRLSGGFRRPPSSSRRFATCPATGSSATRPARSALMPAVAFSSDRRFDHVLGARLAREPR